MSLFVNQIRQIGEGGVFVLLRKLCGIPLIIAALPIVIIVRLLRPFVLVRFGLLPSSRIGHFAGNTELYLCKRDAGMYSPQSFDVFYYNVTTICNYYLNCII